MASTPAPSFSPRRRWSIGLNVALIVLLVIAAVAMLNYLSREVFWRFHWSTRNKVELSPLTHKFLQSLTNKVKVTLYYDQKEPFYSTVTSLLDEYHLANKRISVDSIDYLRDAGAAQRIKNQYKLSFPSATNLIIFEADGRSLVVDGNELTRYTLEPVVNEQEREFRRKPVEFQGERMFTAALLNITNPKRLNAYFLQGHGEHPLDSDDKDYGYLEFGLIVRQNNIDVRPLTLMDTNAVPADCHLLVIAGPRTALDNSELEKIDQYLSQGGRLLVLFNYLSLHRDTGLEKVLVKWGVDVGHSTIVDLDNTLTRTDVIVNNFSKHQVVNPLLDMSLHFVEPRAVGKLRSASVAADAPKIEEIAFTGPNAFAKDAPSQKMRFPLMVAVERGGIKGVITERGSTRMLVAGDSIFFTNHQIGSAANRDFAGYAINWLLDRTQLLDAIGPRPVTEFRILMTPVQMQQARWIFLAGMPGVPLLLGGLVWLRRRK
ncbi:MAG TPA: GldG family protein [Candidatus Dormibacteraeota bacterium]|nr:GldG family protein [Candidatus Dormibacteraeota bacterium]